METCFPQFRDSAKPSEITKPKSQNLGENLLVSAGCLEFLVLHCFFALEQITIKADVFFCFHGVASLKYQENTQVFFFDFQPKKPKTSVKPTKNPAETNNLSLRFWFFVFWSRASSLKPRACVLSKPQAVCLNAGPNRQCRAGQSALRMHHNYMIHDKRFPGNNVFLSEVHCKIRLISTLMCTESQSI